MNPNDPNNPAGAAAGQGISQQPPIHNPGLFSYGAQVAMGAGPGQGAKFQELSGLYASQAVAAVPIAVGATFGMGIPTFAETFRQGAAVRYGTQSGAYKMANFASKFDFMRAGLGGFGSTEMLSTSTMSKLATAGAGGSASPLITSLEQSKMVATTGAVGSKNPMAYAGAGRGIYMTEMGMQASLGKRVHAFIAGGEAAFGRTLAAGAEMGEAIAVGNKATLNAMRARGIGGALKAGKDAGKLSRLGLGFLRGARAVAGATAGTGIGLLPGIAMMAATELVIGSGLQIYQGAADASLGERVMESVAPEGMQYGRGSARNFGMEMGQLAKSSNLDLSGMLGIMDQMSQAGDFNGAKTMTDFRKKLTSRLKELKKVSEETSATMQEVQQLMTVLKQSGVMSYNTGAFTQGMLGLNKSTGIGLDRLMQAGQFGFQQATQMGTDLDMGFASAQKSVAGMEMLVKSGGLSESQMRNITLMGGTDQAALMLQSSAKKMAPMMAVAMDRVGTDSEGFAKYAVNEERMRKFVSGGYSRRELERMMMDPDMAGKTGAFMANTELYSQSVEQMQEAMVNFGIKNASADYTASEIIGRTFGMHKNHAELMINHQMAIRAAEANIGIEEAKSRRQATRDNFDNRAKAGLFSGRTMDMAYESMGLREMGRDISDGTSSFFDWFGSAEREYSASATTRRLALSTTDEDLDFARNRIKGADIGFGSRQYGVYGALNEAERERAYAAYGKRFGRSIDSDFVRNGVEGEDFIIGDQNFIGDIGRMMPGSQDKRAIPLKAVRRELGLIEKARGAESRMDSSSRQKLVSYMRMQRMLHGSSAFEGATMFSGNLKMGSSFVGDVKMKALAEDIRNKTGLDFLTESGRSAMGIDPSVNMNVALGQFMMANSQDAGFEKESIRLGTNQVIDAGLDLQGFSIDRANEETKRLALEKTVTGSPRTGHYVDPRMARMSDMKGASLKGFAFDPDDRGFGAMSRYRERPQPIKKELGALNNYSRLGDAEKLILLEGIQHVASGGKMMDISDRFYEAGLQKEFTALNAQRKYIQQDSQAVLEQVKGLRSLEMYIAYQTEFGERNKEIKKAFQRLGTSGTGTGGGLNRMLSGDLAKDLQGYTERTSIAERKRLTSRILQEITDGANDDFAQMKYLVKEGGISEVYAMHEAFNRLTGNDADIRKKVMDSLGISGQGSGEGGAFTKEEAIKALSNVELAQFKNSEELVKASTLADNPMVNPREFTTTMNDFVTALKDFTKTVKTDKDPSNGDSKEEAESWWSDQRLKKNIKLVNTSPSGIPIYHFEYKNSDTLYEGVMAQDIIKTHPEAVFIEDGYYKVDYSLLDVDFKEV